MNIAQLTELKVKLEQARNHYYNYTGDGSVRSDLENLKRNRVFVGLSNEYQAALSEYLEKGSI